MMIISKVRSIRDIFFYIPGILIIISNFLPLRLNTENLLANNYLTDALIFSERSTALLIIFLGILLITLAAVTNIFPNLRKSLTYFYVILAGILLVVFLWLFVQTESLNYISIWKITPDGLPYDRAYYYWTGPGVYIGLAGSIIAIITGLSKMRKYSL